MKTQSRFADLDTRVLGIAKGNERFVFIFADDPREQRLVMATMRRWVADPDIWFTVCDAEIAEAKIIEGNG